MSSNINFYDISIENLEDVRKIQKVTLNNEKTSDITSKKILHQTIQTFKIIEKE